MTEARRYVDDQGGFEVTLPPGWTAEPDPEGEGVELRDSQEIGVLHLLGFPHSEAPPADPAEELYGFLEEQGIELEEDEVEDLELESGGEVALCEFLMEGEEGVEGEEEPVFWIMAVAVAPEVLIFASYSCPVGEEEGQRERVRAILRSLRAAARP